MDAATLKRAMWESYVSDATVADYLPHFEEAMRAAEITNVRRAAAWCSQIGHESAGLRYLAEIQTSGPDWSWDRTRFRGRGPLQLTWQSNYSKFGSWCKGQGYVDDANLFVNQPELVEQPRWGFLSASWYWLNAGPRAGEINAFADRGEIVNVSRCVNGWVTTPNGMADRRQRWDNCLAIGDALLPDMETDLMGAVADQVNVQLTGEKGQGWIDLLGRSVEVDPTRGRTAIEVLNVIFEQLVGPIEKGEDNPKRGESFIGWEQLGDHLEAKRTLVEGIGRVIEQNNHVIEQNNQIIGLFKTLKGGK